MDNFTDLPGRGGPIIGLEVTIVAREIMDDRWLTLIIGPDGEGREGTSEVYERFTTAVAELAIRMVHGLRDTDDADDGLIALTVRIEQFVELEVKEYAFEVETKRLVASEPQAGLARAVS